MREDPVHPPAVPTSSPTAAEAVRPATALRVRGVDDSARDRQRFEYLLEDFGTLSPLRLECEQAHAGPLALRRLAEAPFDLMVLDQNMPETSGAEVLGALPPLFQGTGNGRTRPGVLAYSTCDAPEFRRQRLRNGADGFCSKYMTPGDLARVLRELGLDRGAPA